MSPVARLLGIALLLFGPLVLAESAMAAPGNPKPSGNRPGFIGSSSVDYRSVTAQERAVLRSCFLAGSCQHMDPSIVRIYPLPCENSGTAPCTGCWEMTGDALVRRGDLDGSRPEDQQCSPGQMRIFIGYRMQCPDATAPGTSCDNGRLLIGCSFRKSSGTNGALNYYDKECLGGTPIVKDPTGTGEKEGDPASACQAGQQPRSGGGCESCPSGTYKGSSGNVTCTACSINVLNGRTWRYATTPTTGAKSPNDCRLRDLECNTGYMPASDRQSCVSDSSCSLALGVQTMNPSSPAYTNGSVTVTVSGNTGSFSAQITSPSVRSPSTTSSSSATFTSLSSGTYRVQVTDSGQSGCVRTVDTTLMKEDSSANSCSLTPTLTLRNPDNSPAYDNGEISVSYSNASGAVTTTISSGGSSTANPAVFRQRSGGAHAIELNDSGRCTVKLVANLKGASSTVCGKGQYLDASTDSCRSCSSGTYMDMTGHTNNICKACSVPNGSFTGSPAGAIGMFAPDSPNCGTLTCSYGYTLSSDGRSCGGKMCPFIMADERGSPLRTYSQVTTRGSGLAILLGGPALPGNRILVGGYPSGSVSGSNGGYTYSWPVDDINCSSSFNWNGFGFNGGGGGPTRFGNSTHSCGMGTCEAFCFDETVPVHGTSAYVTLPAATLNTGVTMNTTGEPMGHYFAWSKVTGNDGTGCNKAHGDSCVLPDGNGAGKIVRLKYTEYGAVVNSSNPYSPSCKWTEGGVETTSEGTPLNRSAEVCECMPP